MFSLSSAGMSLPLLSTLMTTLSSSFFRTSFICPSPYFTALESRLLTMVEMTSSAQGMIIGSSGMSVSILMCCSSADWSKYEQVVRTILHTSFSM